MIEILLSLAIFLFVLALAGLWDRRRRKNPRPGYLHPPAEEWKREWPL